MKLNSLKLYHYPLTRSVRVKWMLHEVLGNDFEVEVVGVIFGAMMTPEMLAKNPNHNLPMLDLVWEDGSTQTMLESGAMVMWLAEAFPDQRLAPAAGLSPLRADYLQMIQFGSSWMDAILWQMRLHQTLLPPELKQESIFQLHHTKWSSEIELQLKSRLSQNDFICGDQFTAADCIVGHNVGWAKGYGLCQDQVFADYLARLSDRPAYRSAYADADQFGK